MLLLTYKLLVSRTSSFRPEGSRPASTRALVCSQSSATWWPAFSQLHSNLVQGHPLTMTRRKRLPVQHSGLCHTWCHSSATKVLRCGEQKAAAGQGKASPPSCNHESNSIFRGSPQCAQLSLHVKQELQSPTRHPQQTRLVGSPQWRQPVPKRNVPLL